MHLSQRLHLIEQSKQLLSQARYLSAQEVYLIESALNNPEIYDQDLQTIYDSLAEYKKEQGAAYADFKKEVNEAISDYSKATTANKS